MFSVDDPVMRHNWTVSLKRQIEIVSASQLTQAENASPFQRAAEQIAFRVLQETLIPSPSADWGNARPAFSSQYFPTQGPVRPLSPRRESCSNTNGKKASLSTHVRSKSRSQVYYRHGAGKLEHQQLDSSPLPNGDATDSPETDGEDVLPPEGGTRLWGGKELEVVCQQNSAIVQVLALSRSEPSNASLSPSPAPLRPVVPVR
jgi:serine/arginine repetitive matrix protein 2